MFIFFQETYLLYLVNQLEARKAFTLDNLELILYIFRTSYNVETICLLLTDLAKFVSFLFLQKTILIMCKHIETISDQLFMSVTSVCQTLYNFIHSQHHRFSGFLHLLVSQHLQALEHDISRCYFLV